MLYVFICSLNEILRPDGIICQALEFLVGRAQTMIKVIFKIIRLNVKLKEGGYTPDVPVRKAENVILTYYPMMTYHIAYVYILPPTSSVYTHYLNVVGMCMRNFINIINGDLVIALFFPLFLNSFRSRIFWS